MGAITSIFFPEQLKRPRSPPFKESAIQSARGRLGADFTFHDLRAIAESDHEVGVAR